MADEIEGSETGGGQATATADAGASAPAGGFLSGVTLPPYKSEAPAAGGGEPEAEGGVAAPEGEGGGTEAGEPDEGTPPKLLAGRFKSADELEAAHVALTEKYGHSSKEGLRLYEQVREAHGGLRTRDARIAELQEELKSAKATPAFKELSKEEFKRLHDDDPAAAMEYLAEKQARVQEAKQEAARVKDARESRTKEAERVYNAILDRRDEMRNKPGEYPDYSTLEPVMHGILKKMPELGGYEWTPDVLYRIALAERTLRAQASAKKAGDKSRDDAKAKAQALAQASGSGAGSAIPRQPAPSGDTDKMDGNQFVDALVANTGHRRYFR